MKLLKTTLLNAIAVAIRVLTLLGLNKVLAVYAGPTGYAMLGQFQNFIQIFTQLSSGALSTGVTKYTAEYIDDIPRQHALWRTAGTVSLISTFVIFTIIVGFSKFFSIIFLGDSKYNSVFILFAGTLIFFVFNAFFMAILNGKKEVSRFIFINIVGSIFSIILTSILAVGFGLYGCLISLVTCPALIFFVTLLLCYQRNWFRCAYFWGLIDRVELKNLSKFVLMTLTSAVCVPAVQLLIRNYIGNHIDWESAGCWEAMSRISNTYLMFVTTTLSVYYLPRLSELKKFSEIRAEIFSVYRLILPVSIGFSLLIYLFRNFIVNTLLSPSFSLTVELFGWQVIGDIIKIASFLLGYVYIAKGYIKLYMFSEIFFSFNFFLFVVILEKYFKLQSVAIAYTFNYLFHLVFVFFSLKFKRVI